MTHQFKAIYPMMTDKEMVLTFVKILKNRSLYDNEMREQMIDRICVLLEDRFK